uniref:Uncharacterized protein n=1 Tax=Amphimedon queenslandica TaxID=400682 RepID=A0A1X7T2M7_AMPQE
LFFHKSLISYSLFGSECLPSLLTLSNDVVPNVRLAVARTLYSTLDNTQFISANQSFSQDISSIISKLKEDRDRDVRYYSGNYEDINNNTRTSLSPSTPSAQQLQQFENTQEDTEYKLDIANAGSILQLT